MNISARVFRSSIIPPVAIAAASLFIVIVFFWMNQSTIQRENRIKASSAKSNYEDLKRGSMAFATMISSYNDVRLGVDDSRRHLVLGVITPLFKNMNVDIITVHERDGFVIAKGHAVEPRRQGFGFPGCRMQWPAWRWLHISSRSNCRRRSLGPV